MPLLGIDEIISVQYWEAESASVIPVQGPNLGSYEDILVHLDVISQCNLY